MLEPLDLRNFIWQRDHTGYSILAITDFEDEDVVVFQENVSKKIGVLTVAKFMKDFQATYQISA